MHKEKEAVEARWRMEREMTSAIDNRKREHRKKINQVSSTVLLLSNCEAIILIAYKFIGLICRG